MNLFLSYEFKERAGLEKIMSSFIIKCFAAGYASGLSVEEYGVKGFHHPIRRLVSTTMTALWVSHTAHAGSFSLYTEASTVAVGNYAAGVAAEVADASTGWYNPAGLVFLGKQQLLVSGVGVIPSAKLTGVSTFETTGLDSYSQQFSNLQAGKNAIVPALHYALPLGEQAAFGLSFISPFGLSTQYPDTSPVRYAATLTQLLTANLSPELAGRLTDNFALGAGLDLQWARVKFNQVLGVPNLLQMGGLNPTSFDSISDNEGTSFGVGFHAGILAKFNQDHTRVGLNYQSRIKHSFEGTSVLTGFLADPDLTTDTLAVFRSDILSSNEISLPDVVTLSVYQDMTERLALLGSVVYTEWSVFRTTQLNNVAAFDPDVGRTLMDIAIPQNYRNTWRFSVGANYRVNERWLLRVGAGYDQTPTVNAERDVRLPDADRWALAVGAHYQMRPCLGFDVGYAYLFKASDTRINKTYLLGTTSSDHVNATAKVNAQLVGLQAVWTIDAPT